MLDNEEVGAGEVNGEGDQVGIQDRDYMRNRGREARGARTTYSPPRGTAPWGSWLARLGLIGAGVLVIFFGGKYFIERRHASPFPETGDVHWYGHETQPRTARLTLRAPKESRRNFAVRVNDWATGAPIAMIPVRSGETAVTLMPLGRYRMTISKGSVWLGSSRLFDGITGESRLVVHPVEFYQRGNQIFGHQIDLEVPFVGNMETERTFLR